MKFSNHLADWYLQNKRSLPWRTTKNPYYIWLSEIILQQTRVDQGMAYYLKFVEQFPTVFDLAAASEETVLKLWQGLGYYSRARNLHFSAKYIVNDLKGVFPTNYNDLKKLKGVGDYTASAIASICFNEPTAVVDGNVYRVLARYFGINTPINTTKGIKEFKILAQELINTKIPGTYNQAIMEFGAIQCKPQNPDCNKCPLNTSCIALSKNTIKLLPIKEKKIKIRKRYFNYLVIQTKNNKTKLVKREKGIWMNMYQFPLIETDKPIDQQELIEHNTFNKLFNSNNITIKLYPKTVKPHKLSHQHIYTKFWIIKTANSLNFNHSWNDIEKYPVPVLIDNFLNEFNYN
ncbi:A/G-specific adenine glycosylase [Lutibacter sp. A80]|uniref:A/G-specific adenine glycosylase n=1 Tax=Lutibacter sp. A80 TaxID=2918453 RepID=UPI001F05CEAA|nr:A/G-specific adenine glycosylase [Lutibacter sp. A80]UMB59337.1 A/G-specific adenine glycosylase [Lutibacter sp. A80]